MADRYMASLSGVEAGRAEFGDREAVRGGYRGVGAGGAGSSTARPGDGLRQVWKGGKARRSQRLGKEHRGVYEARLRNNCFFCHREAPWQAKSGKLLCEFAAEAWRQCYPWDTITARTVEATNAED